MASRDLVTVVGHLVDNALDAVAGHPVRRVSVRLETGDDLVRVVVADSGAGLSADDAAHVLDRGWTTKASAESVGGRGVGLALVGQVARRYAGDVRIDTSELGGARFTVTFRPARVRAGTEPS